MAFESIQRFSDVLSNEEKKYRTTVTLVSLIVWVGLGLAVAGSMGVLLLLFLPGWGVRYLLAEYNVRRLQALGATVSETQFPEVYQAAHQVMQRFGSTQQAKIVVVGSGEMNAVALRFAKKRVVVLMSELLESIIDKPSELRFLLAHEFCHQVFDHGFRATFELYKPAGYKQARELTCDNAGLVAADDLPAATTVLSKLCVGTALAPRLNHAALKEEARVIVRGLSGWLLRNYLSHPPAGTRLNNAEQFFMVHADPSRTPAMLRNLQAV